MTSPRRVVDLAMREDGGILLFTALLIPVVLLFLSLTVDIGNLPKYHGTASFTGGTVKIQNYLPMWANMKAAFVIDGGRIHLERIDLQTDGATTVARGDVDASHWPNQAYQVQSRVHFPRGGASPATATSPACSSCSRTRTAPAAI